MSLAVTYPNIDFASVSVSFADCDAHPLNNYDVNYTVGTAYTDFYTVTYDANGGTGSSYRPDDSITVNGNVTLYAQWREIPSLTEDHISYIFGYPDGGVGPDNNLTRVEAASIFFRLLSETGHFSPRKGSPAVRL